MAVVWFAAIKAREDNRAWWTESGAPERQGAAEGRRQGNGCWIVASRYGTASCDCTHRRGDPVGKVVGVMGVKDVVMVERRKNDVEGCEVISVIRVREIAVGDGMIGSVNDVAI